MAKFRTVALSSIFVGDRERPVDEDYAQALAANMAERGLINPITVRNAPKKGYGATPNILIAGAHRHRAAIINGWTEIDVIEVTATPEDAQLIELSENLFRNELSALDRAMFVLKFREVWEEKHGKIDRTRNLMVGNELPKGHDDPSGIFAPGRGLSEQVQERLGFGPETYKRVTRIGRNLHPSLRQAIRGLDAERDQSKLLKLCKLPADDQVRVADALGQHPDLDLALSFLKPARPEVDPQKKLLDRLCSAWDEASEETREEFLSTIGMSERPDPIMKMVREAAE